MLFHTQQVASPTPKRHPNYHQFCPRQSLLPGSQPPDGSLLPVSCPEAHVCSAVSELFKTKSGTPLGVQWYRIHLPMQGTRVQSLIRGNPTCCGQLSTWSQCSPTREACAPQLESSPCLLQVEKACVQRQRVSIAKNELFLKIKLDISPPLLKLSNGPDNGNKIQHLTTAESPAFSALIFSPTSFPLYCLHFVYTDPFDPGHLKLLLLQGLADPSAQNVLPPDPQKAHFSAFG